MNNENIKILNDLIDDMELLKNELRRLEEAFKELLNNKQNNKQSH